MYTFYLGENEYSIKDKWEELTPEETIYLVDLLSQYLTGKIKFYDVRILFTIYIMGYKPRRIRNYEKQQMRDENFYKISQNLTFFFEIKYEDQKKYVNLAKKTKELLKKHLPEDLEETPEIRVAAKMNRWFEVDGVFSKNLVPQLKIGRKVYKAYTFELMDDIAITSLTAQQFTDAQNIYTQLLRKSNTELFNLFCAVLYQGETYSEDIARKTASVFGKISNKEKQAVLFVFSGIQEFIITRTKYSILFSREKKNKKAKQPKKTGLGFENTIYSLSKAGYGSVKEMQNLPLFETFDLMIKNMADTINQLKDADKDVAEIAKITKLTINQVNELLND